MTERFGRPLILRPDHLVRSLTEPFGQRRKVMKTAGLLSMLLVAGLSFAAWTSQATAAVKDAAAGREATMTRCFSEAKKHYAEVTGTGTTSSISRIGAACMTPGTSTERLGCPTLSSLPAPFRHRSEQIDRTSNAPAFRRPSHISNPPYPQAWPPSISPAAPLSGAELRPN
jgi:hypothetical protein